MSDDSKKLDNLVVIATKTHQKVEDIGQRLERLEADAVPRSEFNLVKDQVRRDLDGKASASDLATIRRVIFAIVAAGATLFGWLFKAKFFP